MVDPQELVNRVVGLYNEPDPEIRAKGIVKTWTPTGEHFGGFRAKGYAGLEAGIQGSHDNVVVNRGWTWRAFNAQVREKMVVCMIEAIDQKTGKVMAFGSKVIEMADDGRIENDYTFMHQSRYVDRISFE